MDELREWLSKNGLDIEPILNGQVHKFNNDGRNDKSGWYQGDVKIVNGKRVTTLTVKDFRWGDDDFLYFKTGGLNEKDVEELKKISEKRNEEFREERKKANEDAKKDAEKIWGEATEICEWTNDYIQKKQIASATTWIKRSGDVLLIPMRDEFAELWGIQRIFPDGTKRFLKGQRKSGCSFLFGDGSSSTIAICEGFATGASVFEATGFTTVVAFDAGNLHSVAQAYANSGKRILICGDDDRWGTKNIGREKAEEAARECGGIAVFPEFSANEYRDVGGGLITNTPTDWNDLHCLEGIDEVRRQIESAISANTSQDGKSGRESVEGKPTVSDAAGKSKSANGNDDEKPKKEKKPKDKISQREIERLGKEILDCRFKLYVDNETTILYNISDIKKKEVVICSNENLLLRRLKRNLEERGLKDTNMQFVYNVYSLWKLSTEDLKGQPKSFTWKNEDEWSFKKLDFVPEEGEYPAWIEFLERLSSAEDFMAFVWSVFEMKNTSRQFMWISDLNGEGGKSTVIGVLADIFGDSFEALNNTNTGSSAKWLMGQLYGKRLAAWADCKNPSFCMSETVRNITSGDWVTVEMKGQPLFSTKMYMKLIIGSNHEPHITGAGADTSRLIHLKLAEGTKKDDPEWGKKLRQELPHFLYACRQVYERKCPHHGKISLSQSTKEHVENASGSTEEKFEEIMESRIILGEGLEASVKEFLDMCRDEGVDRSFEVGNFKDFLKRHHVKLLRPSHGERKRVYRGMSIKPRSLLG